MVSFVSATWRALVAVSGLILFSPFAFAQTAPDITTTNSYATGEAALTACLALQAETSSAVVGAFGGRYTDLTFTYPCTLGTLGTTTVYPNSYACGASVRDTTNNATMYVSCTSSSVPAFRSTPRVVVFRFSGEPPTDQCENLAPFQTRTLRAPTPNGSGDVCYNGCSWSVGIGYVGTYPAGYLEYDFISNGRECNPDEEPPQDTTIDPPETPEDPLDLPPEDGGVDTDTPDPGPGKDSDGKGQSSGGGSCDAPPACTGDSLQCNILYQTWSTRCEAQRIADGGGVGGGEEGIGDAIRDASSENSSWLSGIKDLMGSVFGDGEVDNSGPIPGLSTKDITIDSNSLDTSGLGLPRSCPTVMTTPLTYSFLGSTQSIDFSPYCDLLNLVGTLMVVLASYVGLRILLRGGK